MTKKKAKDLVHEILFEKESFRAPIAKQNVKDTLDILKHTKAVLERARKRNARR